MDALENQRGLSTQERSSAHIYRLYRQEESVTDTADGGQCPERVAQVEHERATNDDIERAYPFWRQVVHVDKFAVYLGAKALGGDTETLPFFTHRCLMEIDPRSSATREVIPLLMTSDVCCKHLGGTSSFYLECKEAVPGSNVEAPQPRYIGPRELLHDWPEVEPARCSDAMRQV